MPYMDEDLREHKLLAILDVLLESDDTPLSIPQIQYRLSSKRGEDMTREEIEAHLRWGLYQPNATNALVKPVFRRVKPTKPFEPKGWVVVPKNPTTQLEKDMVGKPPWLL